MPFRCPHHAWTPDALWLDTITRWYKLRKTHPDSVPYILQDGPYLWLFTDDLHPWDSRVRITVAEIRLLVEEAEGKLRKKAMQTATHIDSRDQEGSRADIAHLDERKK